VIEALGGRVAGFASILTGAAFRIRSMRRMSRCYRSTCRRTATRAVRCARAAFRSIRPAHGFRNDIELIAIRGNEAELRIDGRTHFVPFVVSGSEVNFAYDGRDLVRRSRGKRIASARQASRPFDERADAGRGVENPRRGPVTR